MKNWKKAIVFLMAVLWIGVLSACQKSTGETKHQENRTEIKDTSAAIGSKGRFVESDVKLPDETVYGQQILSDGTLRILCSTGVYDSADQGETWTAWDKQPEKFQQELLIEFSISSAVIAKDGGIYYCLRNEEIISYNYIDKEGNMKNLSPGSLTNEEDGIRPKGEANMAGGESDLLSGLGFSDAGDLLAMDEGGRIYQIDCKADEVKRTYETKIDEGELQAMSLVTIVGNQMLLIYDRMQMDEEGRIQHNKFDSEIIDLESGEKKEGSKVLNDFLSEGAGMDNTEDMSSFIAGVDGNSIYIVNSSGIYRFVLDGIVVEKIFNGALGQMNSFSVMWGNILDEEHFYLLYITNSGYSLIRYTFNREAATLPEKELTVYSLYDNQEMRQAITQFQKENPDIFVNLDIGITGTDAMTESDAIKTLNTNIMAGEGPDILALDGMPVDAYMEKGLLADISDVIDEVAEADGMFTKIAATYQKDKKTLAVPLNFAVPVVMGSEQVLAEAKDLKSFTELVINQKEENPKNLYITQDAGQLLKTLLPTSSAAWLKEDGTLNRNALAEFLDSVRRLTDGNESVQQPPAGGEEETGQAFELAQFMTTGQNYVNEILFGSGNPCMFHIKTYNDLSFVTSYMGQTEEINYKPSTGQAANVYIPINPVGISAKSKESEGAKLFVKYLLDKKDGLAPAWPVNKKAFAACMEKTSISEGMMYPISETDGSSAEFDYKHSAQEEITAFEKLADGLETPAVTDYMINKTVLEWGKKCLRGELSAEEAADGIQDKLNLYLSE